jgi:hypothetical protein
MKSVRAMVLLRSLVLVLLSGITWSQDKAANVAGAWEMIQQGRNGALNQTLTIQQAGAAIKGTVKGPNDEIPFTGGVSGTQISFTVKFVGRNGEEIHEYRGTVTGEEMKGTMAVGERSVDWSAKRSNK